MEFIVEFNQGHTGQYCVQITIERTVIIKANNCIEIHIWVFQEYASTNVDPQHDETHKVHTYRKVREEKILMM